MNLLRAQTAGCISDFRFDQWRAGELGADVVRTLESHLIECESCRLRQSALDAQAKVFLERFPFQSLPAARTHSLDGARKQRKGVFGARKWGVAGALLVAAAGVALVIQHPTVSERWNENTRSKGGRHFGFHIKQGERIMLGVEGQSVHPHNQLRFFVSTNNAQQLAILSRDGGGNVAEYFPGTGRSRGMSAGQSQSLDSSVELDETMGEEGLWAIFCDSPFDTAPLRQELLVRGTLQAPKGCTIDRMTMVKRP